MQKAIEVSQVTTLPFGVGKVGADRHLEGAEKKVYLEALAQHQHEVPTGLWLPFDCMDERETIALADGTNDPSVLLQRRAFQLPGGTVLAFTKAGVAANAAFLRDAKDMQQAYEMTHEVLAGFGIPDAAHAGCGASNFVKKSAAEPVALDTRIRTFKALGADGVEAPLTALDTNKRRRLEAGFYDDWNPAWQADFVSSKYPQNFSYLRTADDEVSGHYANGLLLVQGSRYFAKNAFIAETGAHAFALTLDKADEVANMVGVSDQERALIKLALRDDSFNVANHIVAPGLDVAA